MIRLIPIAATVVLAACVQEIEPGERVLPAEVTALLLPGVPDTVAVQNGDGCYIISNQITEPRQGYFLRDPATQEPLCFDRSGERIPYVPPEPVPAPELAADPAT